MTELISFRVFIACVIAYIIFLIVRYYIKQKHRPIASIKLIFQDRSYKWYSYLRDAMECYLCQACYTKKSDRQIMGRLSNLLHEQGWHSCKIVITRDTYQKEYYHVNALQDNITDHEAFNHRKDEIMKWNG